MSERAVRRKQTSERCEQMIEQTSEFASTLRVDFIVILPSCGGGIMLIASLTNRGGEKMLKILDSHNRHHYRRHFWCKNFLFMVPMGSLFTITVSWNLGISYDCIQMKLKTQNLKIAIFGVIAGAISQEAAPIF